MIDLSRFNSIIFDFDGVILSSNEVKEKAFQTLFLRYGKEAIEKIARHHRENLGMPRDKKIHFYLKNILGVQPSVSIVENYCMLFSQITLTELKKADYLINDTVDYVKLNLNKKRFYIASAAVENDVQLLCREHGLSDYFLGIYGSPKSKSDIVKQIVHERDKSRFALVGDSHHDQAAAVSNGITFFGYNNPQLIRSCQYIHSFKNIDELDR